MTSYIACLDVGTTTIRCQIINSSTDVVGSSRSRVNLIYPHPGFVEIEPEQLWEQVVEVIKNAISDAHLSPKNISCLGISTQRSTFTTWRRDNGKPFHNFITWKDLRAKELCNELNASLLIKTFRCAAYSLYLITRNIRYLIGSRFKIAVNHVSARLLWILRNTPQLTEAIKEDTKNVLFGTVDTWLLYKFTDTKLHLTDISNASATAFFDPFVMKWGSWASTILGIPLEILPEVVDNDYNFGSTVQNIFGTCIPIKCVMADASSSMFASFCFNCDDIKVTIGTGAFLDVNTAKEVHASVTGIYPLVGWTIQKESVFIGEVACNDCGSIIQWLLDVGWISDPSELTDFANKVPDTDGVYFIPAFSGLGPPINDAKAGSGFMGLKPTTKQNHLIRAVLEGLVYRIVLAYNTLQTERPRKYHKLTVDGGVSQNYFICQMIADLTGIHVERLNCAEMSVLGVGYLAGIRNGIWNNVEQLKAFKSVHTLFEPTCDKIYIQKCEENFQKWLKAVERFKIWYEDN